MIYMTHNYISTTTVCTLTTATQKTKLELQTSISDEPHNTMPSFTRFNNNIIKHNIINLNYTRYSFLPSTPANYAAGLYPRSQCMTLND